MHEKRLHVLLPKAEVTRVFRRATQVWSEDKGYLNEIDSRFGDGDHSVTIGKVAGLIERSLDGWDDDDVETFLEDLGGSTMEIGGRSTGLLYGTMIGGSLGPLEGNKPIDVGTLKEIFTEYLSVVEDITNAGVGDKTMTDTLVPAVEAAQSAEDNVMVVPEAAEEAAAKGAEESEQYVSKYGRARSYREKTIGIPDAGAMSTSLFFTGLRSELE